MDHQRRPDRGPGPPARPSPSRAKASGVPVLARDGLFAPRGGRHFKRFRHLATRGRLARCLLPIQANHHCHRAPAPVIHRTGPERQQLPPDRTHVHLSLQPANQEKARKMVHAFWCFYIFLPHPHHLRAVSHRRGGLELPIPDPYAGLAIARLRERTSLMRSVLKSRFPAGAAIGAARGISPWKPGNAGSQQAASDGVPPRETLPRGRSEGSTLASPPSVTLQSCAAPRSHQGARRNTPLQ